MPSLPSGSWAPLSGIEQARRDARSMFPRKANSLSRLVASVDTFFLHHFGPYARTGLLQGAIDVMPNGDGVSLLVMPKDPKHRAHLPHESFTIRSLQEDLRRDAGLCSSGRSR